MFDNAQNLRVYSATVSEVSMTKQMYKVESRDADGKILYQFHIQEISEAEAIRVGKMFTTKEALAGTWSATKC